MTNSKIKTDRSGKTLSLLENALFVCCVVVLALRTTFTEAPTPQSSQIQGAINDTVYSLAMSGILIFSLLLLLLVRLLKGRFSYKTTAMEIGLALLLTAATLATFFASNKRAAITSSLTLLAPLLMAILLVQLLDSHAKIKTLLIAIIALGIIASWQSAEQFFVGNKILLQQYQDDPNLILDMLGIEHGSLNQMLLEHRISSQDVRASFTTSNSAGSFLILTSFAAIALFFDRLKARKSAPAPMTSFLLAAAALVLVLLGFPLIRSKGAFAAFLFAALVFALLLFSKRPKLPKNIILAGCVIAVIVLTSLVAWFGLKSGRLPGGNSMLVRWQYWHASAQMVADHPLVGVGPGNFTTLYHRYKPPSAPETVSDPHCFLLSILTQYGPLGLLGLLLIVLIPLWRSSLAGPFALEKTSDAGFKKLAAICVLAVVAAMSLLRPFILPPSTAFSLDEKFYVFSNAYMVPAALFIVAFAILIKSLRTTRTGEYAVQNTSVTAAALFCGLLGVLVHNLIDFAIFEPGVLMTFCASIACLIALDYQNSDKPALTFTVPVLLKTAVVAIVLVIGFGYFNYALLPVAKSTAKITEASRPIALGQFPLAHNLLNAATADDPLSPDAPLKNGRLYLQHLYSPTMPQSQMLDNAEQALFTAALRSPDDYKPFDLLTDLYFTRAQLQPGQKGPWLNKALNVVSHAIELYPGDAELHFRLAQIAEQLGQTDAALEHYQSAVRIENSFREQFRLMYPDRKVFSRMPEDEYLLAEKRINSLSQKTP